MANANQPPSFQILRLEKYFLRLAFPPFAAGENKKCGLEKIFFKPHFLGFRFKVQVLRFQVPSFRFKVRSHRHPPSFKVHAVSVHAERSEASVYVCCREVCHNTLFRRR